MHTGVKMKTAIVLGATGGLGKIVCKELIQEDYNIIGSYHNKKPEKDIKLKGRLKLFPLDIEERDSVDKFIDKINDVKIDLIIIGLSTKATPMRYSDINSDLLKKELESNVINQYHIINKISHNINKGANIIFILTEAIVEEMPKYFLPYICSKYALLGIMKSLSLELKDKGISVNAVSPGMMETRFISHIPKFVKEIYARKNRLNRLVKVEEVYSAVSFLIKNPKVNGENLHVFGKDLEKWKSE